MKRLFIGMGIFFALTSLSFADQKMQDPSILGDQSLESGDYPAAVDAYTKALTLNPKNGNAYAGLGAVDYFQKNFESALTKLEEAEKLGTQGNWAEEVYAYHGNSLLELGQNEKAVEIFEKLKTQNPQSKFAYIGLTTAYLRMNNMEGFVKNAEQLAQLQPDVATYYSLGQGYLTFKKYDQAKETFLKAKGLAEANSNQVFLDLINTALGSLPS